MRSYYVHVGRSRAGEICHQELRSSPQTRHGRGGGNKTRGSWQVWCGQLRECRGLHRSIFLRVLQSAEHFFAGPLPRQRDDFHERDGTCPQHIRPPSCAFTFRVPISSSEDPHSYPSPPPLCATQSVSLSEHKDYPQFARTGTDIGLNKMILRFIYSLTRSGVDAPF